MSERMRAYRFGTPEQWRRCLVSGFDVATGGAIQPVPRLGLRPYLERESARASLVATDRWGDPVWRVHAEGRAALLRVTELQAVSRPFEIDETLGTSTRWVLARQWLWAAETGAPIVRRYDRYTVAEERALDVRELRLRSIVPSFGRELTILDLASDGRDGVWLLIESGEQAWLLHLDCDSCPQEVHVVPAAARRALQLGTLGRGTELVLLTDEGRLVIVDARTGRVLRTLPGWNNGPCRHAVRLATDLVSRIALLARERDAARWAVFVIGAQGGAVDVISGPNQQLTLRPNDIALAPSVLWLAADDGLWRLDSTEQSIARESQSVLITPALQSSPTDEGGGWLRAEIAVDLPPGAVVAAQAIGTNDSRVVDEASRIANDSDGTAAQRQQALWDLLDPEQAPVFHLTAPAAKGQPLAVPLFGLTGRWLWLRLTLTTPPGVAPPAIRELRVLYPNASLVQYLPAVFRGTEGDPTGFLRSLVGVLETTTQAIDGKIRSLPSQLDADLASPEWLDYVARWLDLPWENALPVDARRRIVRDAGALIEQRGTRRGLQLLLDALVGPSGHARIVDVTADHPVTRLGGAKCHTGARLPLLLAGPPRSAPILGSRAILGRACLGVPCDPLALLTPRLRIVITAPRATQRALGSHLHRVLAQYVPAGISIVVAWQVGSAAGIADAGGDEVLDANGPGRLGEDSELGRLVLSRRGGVTVDSAGIDLGFGLS